MLLIASVDDIAAIRKCSGLTWVYIGGHNGIEKTKDILKESDRRFIARDIENISDSVRDNFVDYIGRLSAGQSDKVLWYSSSMASKSITQSSMFRQYIYLKLLEKLSGVKGKDVLLLTDDAELMGNAGKARFEGVRILSKPLTHKKSIRGHQRILRYLFLWFISRFLKNKRLKEFDVLIHSWINTKTFHDLPRFSDSELADLGDILANRGYRVGRLVHNIVAHNVVSCVKYISGLHRHFTNIVYPLSYLGLADLTRRIFVRFDVTVNSDGLADIKDLKILNILTENEISKENASKAYMDNLLLLDSYKCLDSKINGEASFIYPFENQTWEKMLNLAFSRFKRIGYQHSSIPYNWLDYYTSRHEIDAPLPDVILTAGKRWSDFLKGYYPGLVIKEAGALRYPYLFKAEPLEAAGKQPGQIAVILPISPAISLSLLKQLLMSLNKGELEDHVIKIKAHPYSPKSPEYARIKRSFTAYKNCAFVGDDVNKLFKNCSLLITSNSTVAFESIFSGIKTLYFIPEDISFDLEHFIRDHLFIAYEEDFSQKLKEALNSSAYPKADIAEYFAPPDYNVFLEHLPLKKERAL